MRNTNKKGFTIVELVVVIAVIAILAAVLIPTFSGVIKKANLSADQQAVTSMNEILKMEEASGNKPETAIEALELLRENKYSYNMRPYFDDYTLAWIASDNVVVLVQDNAVVYPKDYVGVTEYNLFKTVENDPAKLQAAIAGLKDGEVLLITEDMKATDTVAFNFSEEKTGSFGLDLNGNTLTSKVGIQEDSSTGVLIENVVKVADGNNVTFSNGTIEADGKATNTCLYVDTATATLNGMKLDNVNATCNSCLINYKGTLTLSNTEVNASGIAIQCLAGYTVDAVTVLNNVTATSKGDSQTNVYNDSAIALGGYSYKDEDGTKIGGSASVTVNGGTYTGKYFVSAIGSNDTLTLTINDGTFNGGIYDTHGWITLKIFGGTFNTTDGASIAKIQAAVQPGCTITINGQSYSNN